MGTRRITDLDSIQNVQSNIYQKLVNKLISKNNGVIALNFWGLKDRNGGKSIIKIF